MAKHRKMKGTLLATLVTGGIALALNGAGHALADDNDTAFLQALAARGLNCDTVKVCGHTKDTSGLIALGHAICDTLDANGGNVSGATNAIASGAAISRGDAAYFVADAISSYCPVYQR